jgi:T5SS/PEP-CTERM-associated repeat protein
VTSTAGRLSTWIGSNGTVTVDGADSAWNIQGSLEAGGAGSNSLIYVRNGGTLTNTDATVGNVNNANPGAVQVSGNASWHSAGDVSVAPIGSATLTIDSGGEVIVDGTLTLGAGATVSMANNGGLLRAGTIDNTGGAAISWLDGTLSFGAFLGDLVNYGGTLAPGLSAGTATIFGDYRLQNDLGVLAIELAGAGFGEYDVLDVQGTFFSNGILDVSLLGGFSPAAGQVFDIMNWGTYEVGSGFGAFDTINLPGLSPGLEWDVSNLYVSGEIAIIGSPVPVPGAFWLLGSGLLGLVRLRGKRAV